MKIPLFKMSYNAMDTELVNDVITRGAYWAEGPEIEDFEQELIKYQGLRGVLVCNSGTSALHMALIACGVKHFHEVIVPSFTFIASVNAVKMLGAEPVFADIEPETMGLDPVDVEKRITPKTKAIIAVHYAGHPCKIQELRRIAIKHNLMLIEDCAEAQGAKVDNKMVGTFGDCAVLSFCQNKIISTGEGGALITDNKYIYDQCKLLRSHGRAMGTSFDDAQGDYVTLGYNYRLSSMQAALGISQLSRIEEFIERRNHKSDWYCERLSNLKNITLPMLYSNTRHVYQLYTIRLPDDRRDTVMNHLRDKGIGCKVYFNPVHLTSFYKRQKWSPVSLPVTEHLSKEVLSLPIYPDLTENEVDQVCKAIKEALN
jgi:dTDP-4-amino-4,6-dideoxygalactose transaminase